MSGKEQVDLKLETELPVGREDAFEGFVRHLIDWWPSEYTWSQDLLEEMVIEAKAGGACYEVGPHRFRCDWGRVTHYSEPEEIAFLWQISPKREPVPNPREASEVFVSFAESRRGTKLLLHHRHFENHGESGEWYRDALASPAGWPRILESYRNYLT